MQKIVDLLFNDNDKITCPSVYDNVSQITPDEEKLYENIQDFDIDSLR